MDCTRARDGGAATLSTLPLSKFSRRLSSSLAVLLLLGLASAGILKPAESGAEPLLVAAAADLSPLEPALTKAFLHATGIRVRFVLGSSGMLARQIEQGAPYDVFLSANEKFVADLTKQGRLEPESVGTYAYGRVGLWSKSGSVRSLAELAGPAVLHLAIANPAHAPYGLAAEEVLKNQRLWGKIQAKVVYGENVRQALEYAQSGNADAVITAWSLLWDRGGILLPESWHSPIRQACGVVKSTGRRVEAKKFLGFLASPEGRAILKRYGLFPPK